MYVYIYAMSHDDSVAVLGNFFSKGITSLL